jgi:hypothetical protein
MPTTITERFDSRRLVASSSSTAELLYTIMGTEDESEALTLLQATRPATYLDLLHQSDELEHVGGGVWQATVQYGVYEPPEVGQSSFAFDTGGGTTHVTQSKQTLGSYAPPGFTAPNFQGAIGVTLDSVEGTDITVPVYNFSETHNVNNAFVTGSYKLTLFSLTGRVNASGFKGFAAGEVLFLGASGSKRGNDNWEITYKFAASPNVSGLTIGNITGINKRGWDYLWVRYADVEDQFVLVKQPIAVYVERVYLDGNFSALGIGT